MQRINISTWARKDAYEANSRLANPFCSMTFELDVTNLYRYTHEKKISFYHSMVYLVTKAVNQVDAFHYIVENGEVYRVDKREPSMTELRKGEEQYYCVYVPYEEGMDMETFCREAARRRDEQRVFIDMVHENSSLIYISCLPWMDILSVTNPMNDDPDDSVPRIVWGKYIQKDGRYRLHMSLEVNHRLLDGLHAGRFYQAMCALLEQV